MRLVCALLLLAPAAGVGGVFPGDMTCLMAGMMDEPCVEEAGVWDELVESTNLTIIIYLCGLLFLIIGSFPAGES